MPRWLSRLLARIHTLAEQGRVRFTLKALRELAALGLGLDETDACHTLTGLTAKDFRGRLVSRLTGEWMYVFGPRVGGTMVYLKLILREDCVVISFHEEEVEDDDQEDTP